MLRRVALLVLGVGAFVAVQAGTAVATDTDPGYAPTKCNFDVSRGSPAPGETITVTGRWPAGGLDVAISIDPPGSIIGRAITAADGTFTTRVTIPSAQPLGSTKLTARDSSGACELTAVLAISKPSAARALAFTGSSDSTGTIVAVAAVAVALGSVLVVATRRRNRAHSRLGS